MEKPILKLESKLMYQDNKYTIVNSKGYLDIDDDIVKAAEKAFEVIIGVGRDEYGEYVNTNPSYFTTGVAARHPDDEYNKNVGHIIADLRSKIKIKEKAINTICDTMELLNDIIDYLRHKGEKELDDILQINSALHGFIGDYKETN